MKIKYEVARDCFCEGYLHELRNYPRLGMKEMKFKKGEIVTLIKEWSNLYGTYLRVENESGEMLDIKPENLIR